MEEEEETSLPGSERRRIAGAMGLFLLLLRKRLIYGRPRVWAPGYKYTWAPCFSARGLLSPAYRLSPAQACKAHQAP